MPTRKREARRTLTIELPEDLARRLDDLVSQTRRSVNAEILQALEFWLERQGMGESAVEPEEKPPARPPKPR
jgi:predicted transcriptional regulator